MVVDCWGRCLLVAIKSGLSEFHRGRRVGVDTAVKSDPVFVYDFLFERAGGGVVIKVASHGLYLRNVVTGDKNCCFNGYCGGGEIRRGEGKFVPRG